MNKSRRADKFIIAKTEINSIIFVIFDLNIIFMLHRNKVLETVSKLNEEFSMDELFEKISFIEEVEVGLDDIKNGRTISEEELEKEIQKWRK